MRTLVDQSPETSSPPKKGRTQSPNLDQTKKVSSARPQPKQVSDVRPQPKLHLVPASTAKTPTTLFSHLHQQLEGEAILVGDILKMDIPLKYFFGGNLA
jgi:hypothetical protein